MSEKKKYDSTIARIAGNIAGHCFQFWPCRDDDQATEIAQYAVGIARAIVAEVERTEPDLGTEGETR